MQDDSGMEAGITAGWVRAVNAVTTLQETTGPLLLEMVAT